jgi:hypothetical protein
MRVPPVPDNRSSIPDDRSRATCPACEWVGGSATREGATMLAEHHRAHHDANHAAAAGAGTD